MLKFNAREGMSYVHDATHKEYELLELTTIQGKASPDVISIWDMSKNPMVMVNFVYGAEDLKQNLAELDDLVRYYVDEYETRSQPRQNIPHSDEAVAEFINHLYKVDNADSDDEWEKFTEAEWTINFMGKTVTLYNNADTLSYFWQILKQYAEDYNISIK